MQLSLEYLVDQDGLGSVLSAVTDKGVVYLGSPTTLEARDEGTGRVVWSKRGRGEPLSTDGVNLLSRVEGAALLTRLRDGELLGRFWPGSGFRCAMVGSLLVDGSTEGTRSVLCGGGLTGVPWQLALGSNDPKDDLFARRLCTGIATDGKRVFFGLNDGVVMCVAAQSGKVAWSTGLGRPALSRLCVSRGAVHLLVEGCCVALDRSTGRILWKSDGGFYAFIEAGDHVVVWNGREAVELKDGEVVRATRLRNRARSTGTVMEPFAAYAHYLLSGSDSGHVMAFDRASGECIASFRPSGGMSTKVGDVPMAVGKGRLYYRDWSKRLYCLRADFLEPEDLPVRRAAQFARARRSNVTKGPPPKRART